MKKRLAVLIGLVLIASAATSQVGEKITVNLVEVPVTVVSRDGNPVRGLTAENFQLLDDGKPQKITSFDKIDFASQESISATSPLNPNARRAFLLLFDLAFSSPTGLKRAQEAAHKFVADSVKPRDLVAVGTIQAEHGFKLLSAFTTDRELVSSAINNPVGFRNNDPLQIANTTRTFEAGSSGDLAGARAGMADDAMKEIANSAAKQNEQFVRGRIEKQIDTLGTLASTLRSLPGRKQVVLLSEGFDPKYVRGRDVRDTAGTQNDMVALERGQTWTVDSDERYGSTSSMKFLEDMGKVFRTSDTVLNAIDIQGVRVLNDVTGGTKFNSNDALYLLARPTGGEVFANSNSLTTDFQKMMRQQEVVYVLSFYAPANKAGKLHNLSVKLVNVPNARASYRSGYFEAGGENAMQRTLSDAEIVMNDIAQEGIRMHAVAGAYPSVGENAQVPVILEVNGADLLKETKGNSAIEVFLYAFDSEGLVRDRLYQKVTLDVSKVGQKLRTGGVKYWGTLSLPPGTYAVKALVKTPDQDRRGFARADVVVPKAGEVALAPFFIDEKPADWVLVKGTSHDSSNANPFSIHGQTLVPSTVATDWTGEKRKLALIVRNAKPDEVTIETTPKTTILGKMAAGDATEFVVQLDAAPSTPTMQVLVKKKGTAAPAQAVVAIQ